MAGIYFHIPFCRKACTYCDFHFSTNQQGQGSLLGAMRAELDARHGELEHAPVGTLYFGGGTPSIVGVTEIDAIIGKARALVTVEQGAEVTLEANPDDITPENLLA